MLYESVLKPALFRFDPEDVHDFFIGAGEFLGENGLPAALVGSAYGYRGPDISTAVDGIRYRTPFLLSAGFDYNARLSGILPHIGLGGEEAGSVTARPCLGNPKPRLARLPHSESILVNKGLRNDGVDAVIRRLKARGARSREDGFVVGISIARTNDARSSSVEAGIDDYAYSFRRLNEEGVGDYYTINISCPNSFGGEAFTSPALLRRLLAALERIPCAKPVYVKMPLNLPWEDFRGLLGVMDKARVQGAVIGNLNKDYASLADRSEAPVGYCGGLSGAPCERPSTDLIRKTRQAFGRRFTIFGVGGVMSPETAMAKFDAGADLVQLITGLIYKGPGLMKELCRAYAVRRH
ncbi:MAG: quinone-dependent dihydroorotate dehydrogenase [Patescibacteria group bacterium]|nr:quinone-dependent dihydroorotate dehydrogenase [Patescibacteria group bacterium]